MYMPTPVCRARAYRAADESDFTSPSALLNAPEADSSDEEFESKKQKPEPK